MTAARLETTTALAADDVADLAVTALRAEADLTPKPGLVDRRGTGAHADMDLSMLHDSAESLRGAFTECASAAGDSDSAIDLRVRLGLIGRNGEEAMLDATGGVNTHRGALWALGLLSAGAAVRGDMAGAIDVAALLARIPDPALEGDPIATMSHGARVRRRYGTSGAAGEAQAGFPHVRRHAFPALHAARRAGLDEASARLDALLSLVAHLDDTCVLHRGGPAALSAVQAGALAVRAAGGCRTPLGRDHFTALDRMCLDRRLSPGGSGDLLSVTLFLDALDERTSPPCRL
ncbi:triphosphoribosyl-dephospho-CoA synthase [Pseudonocardia xinjiangensis]|uniref:triphosphoribosyl-dephospho-CoA synthase n=1 Tax=Pseudonocardia xinjiangensis TaxID=75289 RepID=UPI003D8CE110